MPIYEYVCTECGTDFEKLQRFGDTQPESCPNGHKQVQRRLSQPAIIFKGSGFYVTDNGRSARNGASHDSRPKKKSQAGSGSESKEESTS